MAKRPLGSRAPGSLTELLETEERIKDFIRGTAGGSGPLTDAVRTGAQRTCDAVGAAPDLVRDAVSLVSAARLCRPYWQDQGYSEPQEQVPFQGGQCRTTLYRFAATATNQTGQVFNLQRDLYGPVSLEVGVRNGNDGFVEIIGNSGPTDAPPNFFGVQGGVGANGARFTVSGVSVVALSGPDNCGNPPGEFVPGPNPPPNPGTQFQPDFDPVTGQPLFEVPDTYVDPITGPAPVPGPDETGEDGGDGSGDPAAPYIPLLDRPVSESPPLQRGPGEGTGEEEFGEPPEGEAWIGFHLNVTTPFTFDRPIPGSEANPAYPKVLGNAAIKYEGISAPRGSTQLLVRSRRLTLITDAPGLTISGAYVNVNPDFQYEVIPLSVPTTPPEEV